MSKKILCIVPARGGSKGIPGKNIKPLAEKPLIAYVIEAAKASRHLTQDGQIVVSTDSAEIADVANAFGAETPFLRPQALASDHSPTVDAIRHALAYFEAQSQRFELVVLLQPTQPFVTGDDIDRAIDEFYGAGSHQGLVGVSAVKEHPILMRTISDEGRLVSLLNVHSTVRRQDMPSFYKVNGCIYINTVTDYAKSTLSLNDNPIPFVMPQDKAIDIDDMRDFEYADWLMRRSH